MNARLPIELMHFVKSPELPPFYTHILPVVKVAVASPALFYHKSHDAGGARYYFIMHLFSKHTS